DDLFGWSVALSADGSTLAIGAIGENGNAVGIDGDASDDSAEDAGAVYLFRRSASGDWTQQAYVKASNTNVPHDFGWRVALSAEGDTLAVAATGEDSKATGIDGNPLDNSAEDAGAVYVYRYTELDGWKQQAYVKSPDSDIGDNFGSSLALSGDGNT